MKPKGNFIISNELGVVHELLVGDMAEYLNLNSEKAVVSNVKLS